LLLSWWSIRRKLLVCLAIVLAIVAALAYSGFSGGYSYRELARTIGVRAKDLSLAGELRESLGDLRVSLSQTQVLENTIASDGVSQNFLRNQFHDKLAKVEDDLLRYRDHLSSNELSDPRFGDRSQEQQTLDELEKELERLKHKKTEPEWFLDASLPSLVGHEVDEMYTKARGLQAKMHDRMAGFARDVKSEYRTWIITEWTATIGALIFLPIVIWLF